MTFNGASATSYNVDSGSQITAIVLVGASSGPVGVATASGTVLSSSSFTVVSVSGPYRVYVGYYDTHHSNNPKPKPSPWLGSSHVLLIGTNGEGNDLIVPGNWDSSAVRVDNVGGAPLTVHVTVDIPSSIPTAPAPTTTVKD